MPEHRKEQNKKDGEFDKFIANSIYPEAEQIFSFRPKPLEDIKQDCYMVVDTNALLVPYNTGKDSLEQIRQTYRQLVAAKRLIIPGQVAREFAKNRAEKIGQLFQQISTNNSQNFSPLGNYPLLESFAQYQKAQSLAEEIAQQQRAYKKALAGLLDHIRDWMWNDPISLLYGELFTSGVVFDEPIDEEEMQRDLERRRVYHIPPGYKDGAKEDSGIGDLLIWHTILHVGEKHQKSVIFVSGDEKSDWWTRGANQALYPRYELVSEFARHSGGATFHIIKFSDLLKLYGATERVVEEVRHEEKVIQASAAIALSTFVGLSAAAIIMPRAAKLKVNEWLIMKFSGSRIQFNPTGSPDIWIINEDGSRVAVEIHYRSDPSKLKEIPQLAFLEHFVSKQSESDKFIVVIVVPEETVPSMLTQFLSLKFDLPNSKAVLGYIGTDLVFHEAASSLEFQAE